jgi:hypothetical protein
MRAPAASPVADRFLASTASRALQGAIPVWAHICRCRRRVVSVIGRMRDAGHDINVAYPAVFSPSAVATVSSSPSDREFANLLFTAGRDYDVLLVHDAGGGDTGAFTLLTAIREHYYELCVRPSSRPPTRDTTTTRGAAGLLDHLRRCRRRRAHRSRLLRRPRSVFRDSRDETRMIRLPLRRIIMQSWGHSLMSRLRVLLVGAFGPTPVPPLPPPPRQGGARRWRTGVAGQFRRPFAICGVAWLLAEVVCSGMRLSHPTSKNLL